MKLIAAIITILLVCNVLTSIPHYTKKQINELISNTKINYGSTVRIKANAFNFLYALLYLVCIHIMSTILEEVDTSLLQVFPMMMTTILYGPSRKPTDKQSKLTVHCF